MPAVVVRRAPRSPRLEAKAVRKIADRMLRELDLGGAELSVVLSDDASVRALNREHRGKDRPTDVLAFPMEDDDAPAAPGAPRLLGDVVVSLDTAARQAQNRGHSLMDEVTFLLAHGLLHLLGHDHQTDAEERAMNAETARLVARAGRSHRAKPT